MSDVNSVEAAGFIPLGFIFGEDFLVHHMNVDPDATVRDICEAAAGFVSGVRVPRRQGDFHLFHEGEEKPLDARAQDVGIGWMDYVEIKVGG